MYIQLENIYLKKMQLKKYIFLVNSEGMVECEKSV